MHIRCLAWLHTIPEKASHSRLEHFGDIEIWSYISETSLNYLVRYFFEIGAYMSGGMGASPLTWQEINAWASQIGIVLKPYESRALKLASVAYVSQQEDAKKADCPPPYMRSEEEIQRAKATRIKNLFRS